MRFWASLQRDVCIVTPDCIASAGKRARISCVGSSRPCRSRRREHSVEGYLIKATALSAGGSHTSPSRSMLALCKLFLLGQQRTVSMLVVCTFGKCDDSESLSCTACTDQALFTGLLGFKSVVCICSCFTTPHSRPMQLLQQKRATHSRRDVKFSRIDISRRDDRL